MNVFFPSGPATVVSSKYINYLDLKERDSMTVSFHQIMDDYRLIAIGDFSKFQLYVLTEHTRFRIRPDSVKLIDDFRFQAEIIFLNKDSEEITKEITFCFDNEPIKSVKICQFGRDYNTFNVIPKDVTKNNQMFPVDLTLITRFTEDFDYTFPLEIKYIGIVEAEGRTVKDRLGKGHEKLQDLLGEHDLKHEFKSCSILLYKQVKPDYNFLSFPEVIETLEASLIQYFKPEKNIEHKDFPKNNTKLKEKLKSMKINRIYASLESPLNTMLCSKHKNLYKAIHEINLRIE